MVGGDPSQIPFSAGSILDTQKDFGKPLKETAVVTHERLTWLFALPRLTVFLACLPFCRTPNDYQPLALKKSKLALSAARRGARKPSSGNGLPLAFTA